MKDINTTVFGALAGLAQLVSVLVPDAAPVAQSISALFLGLFGYNAGDKKRL